MICIPHLYIYYYSVTLAAKYFDDQYFNNAYYARVGGVQTLEMNSLELEFLFLINFTLFVPPTLYHQYYTELVNHATSHTCDICETYVSPEKLAIHLLSNNVYLRNDNDKFVDML